MTKSLSEQLCEICGIKPRYNLDIDLGTLDLNYSKDELTANYENCISETLPDFTKPENFVKLLELMTGITIKERLSGIVRLLKVESGDYIDDRKQAIRETDWDWS